jgi:hypothetical protein
VWYHGEFIAWNWRLRQLVCWFIIGDTTPCSLVGRCSLSLKMEPVCSKFCYLFAKIYCVTCPSLEARGFLYDFIFSILYVTNWYWQVLNQLPATRPMDKRTESRVNCQNSRRQKTPKNDEKTHLATGDGTDWMVWTTMIMMIFCNIHSLWYWWFPAILFFCDADDFLQYTFSVILMISRNIPLLWNSWFLAIFLYCDTCDFLQYLFTVILMISCNIPLPWYWWFLAIFLHRDINDLPQYSFTVILMISCNIPSPWYWWFLAIFIRRDINDFPQYFFTVILMISCNIPSLYMKV